MSFTKSLGLIFFGILGIGGPITSIGYVSSQESFWKYIEKECLHEDVETGKGGDWEKAQKKLFQAEQNESMSKEFKSLKEKLNSDNSDSEKETGKYLKQLCVDTYSQIYKSWFQERGLLLKDLKAFCSLKIQDKLEESKKFSLSESSDQEQIRQKLKELKNHSESNGTLVTPLIALKEKVKPKNKNDQEKLRKWCQDIYVSPYLGKSSNNELKLAQKYCQK